MRFSTQLIAVFGIGLLLAQVLPWWSIALAGALAGFIWHGHKGKSFLAGFLGGLLLWTGAALAIAWTTGSDLHDKFALLISPALSGTLLAVVAGVIAGIVAGLAALSGDALRQAIKS